MRRGYREINETKLSLDHIVKIRLPWLVLGLLGGAFLSFFVSEYQSLLEKDISLAFFIPLIVYMSDAVGTQTDAIYIRIDSRGGFSFWKYFFKEILVGIFMGAILGAGMMAISWFWLKNVEISLTIGLAMFINVAIAPAVVLIITETIEKLHSDPAAGVGPFATVIQDFISVMIYFAVAMVIVGR